MSIHSSYNHWTNHFNSSPSAVKSLVLLAAQAFEIENPDLRRHQLNNCGTSLFKPKSRLFHRMSYISFAILPRLRTVAGKGVESLSMTKTTFLLCSIDVPPCSLSETQRSRCPSTLCSPLDARNNASVHYNHARSQCKFRHQFQHFQV